MPPVMEDHELLLAVREWADMQCVERAHEGWAVYKLTQLWEASDRLLEMFEGRSFTDVPTRDGAKRQLEDEVQEILARESPWRVDRDRGKARAENVA